MHISVQQLALRHATSKQEKEAIHAWVNPKSCLHGSHHETVFYHLLLTRAAEGSHMIMQHDNADVLSDSLEAVQANRAAMESTLASQQGCCICLMATTK